MKNTTDIDNYISIADFSSFPKGKPKSGRVWKDYKKKRFSSFLYDKPLKTSWEKKMQEKKAKQAVKAFQNELKEAKQKELEKRRKRIEENRKRKLENERNAEIVQPIKNANKIKKMSKKQLRHVQKR